MKKVCAVLFVLLLAVASFAQVSFAKTRSGSPYGRLSSETLPFSCPLRATKSGKRQQTPATGEGRNSTDSTGMARDLATHSKVQQRAANAVFSAC